MSDAILRPEGGSMVYPGGPFPAWSLATETTLRAIVVDSLLQAPPTDPNRRRPVRALDPAHLEAVISDLRCAWHFASHLLAQPTASRVNDRRHTLLRLQDALRAALEGNKAAYERARRSFHGELPEDSSQGIRVPVPWELSAGLLLTLRRGLHPQAEKRPPVAWHNTWPLIAPEHYADVIHAIDDAVQAPEVTTPGAKQRSMEAVLIAQTVMAILACSELSTSPDPGGLAAHILEALATDPALRWPAHQRRPGGDEVRETWSRHLKSARRNLRERSQQNPRVLESLLGEIRELNRAGV